jgi:hypothetical protein
VILLLVAVLLFGRSGCLKWALVIFLIGWACKRHPDASREAWEYLQSLEQRMDEIIDQYEQSHGSRAVVPQRFKSTPEKTPPREI